MTRRRASIILDPVRGLRDRLRADGSWRLWWEPDAAQRALGAKPVDFDAGKPAHASREAKRLNDQWSGAARPVRASGRSVSDLINDYRRSRGFTRLRATTQAAYDTDLRAIETKWGPHAVALFDKPAVSAWYEVNMDRLGVWRAKALNTMLSILMGHAELRGWRPENSNPCAGIKVETPPERDRVASPAEVRALLDAARAAKDWDTLAAIYLGMAAGQRVTDIRQAAPGDFRPVLVDDVLTGRRRIWVWSLVQSKRGRAVDVPLHPAMVPVIRLLQARARAQGFATLLVYPATGKALTKESMFKAWDRIRAAAAHAVPSAATLDQRDLRRTFSTLSRAGGARVDDVTDVLGNTANKNARLRQTYMAAQLATQLRAVEAIALPGPDGAKSKKVG